MLKWLNSYPVSIEFESNITISKQNNEIFKEGQVGNKHIRV